MKFQVFSIVVFLILWKAPVFAGENGIYSCQHITETDISDYNFDVIPIKKGGEIKIEAERKLNLSDYAGKVVLLSVFSEHCGWCAIDMLYYYQKEYWLNDEIVMVNLSFGRHGDAPENFDSSPLKMRDYVTEGYKTNKFDMEIDVAGMDFYHFVSEKSEGKSGFKTLQELRATDDQAWLFPGLMGTPYHLIVDKKGEIRFRGHFTGRPWRDKLNRHYGFIDSLLNNSCEAPKPSG